MTFGCVVLAAGAGSRFGGNKLAASVNGNPIIEYILDSLPARLFHRVVVVTANPSVIAAAQRRGFELAFNDRPDLGVSRSIRLGLELMTETDACMFCVADQPLLKRETLAGMIDVYEPGTILIVSHNGQSGNPVIYPASLYGELKSLEGEESGKTVACRYEPLMRLFHVSDANQLMDIDTRKDLEAIEARLSDSPDAP
jgi:molybdenum cofactor cytidylyltransferase